MHAHTLARSLSRWFFFFLTTKPKWIEMEMHFKSAQAQRVAQSMWYQQNVCLPTCHGHTFIYPAVSIAYSKLNFLHAENGTVIRCVLVLLQIDDRCGNGIFFQKSISFRVEKPTMYSISTNHSLVQRVRVRVFVSVSVSVCARMSTHAVCMHCSIYVSIVCVQSHWSRCSWRWRRWALCCCFFSFQSCMS